MNFVCLVGSPHGLDGNTFHLVEAVLEGIRRKGGKVRIASLGKGSVLPCLGCDTCHRSGDCPQEDDFEEIREAIEEADGLILASPNYLGSVSAQCKAFMDRCGAAIHCLAFSGKYGVSVVTSGADDGAPVTAFMDRFLLMTGIHPVGAVYATMAQMIAGEFDAKIRREAHSLGELLVDACRDRLSNPAVEQEMTFFRERMRQLVVYKKEEWPYEYRYWQEQHGTA
jgi:multimeric flavodoxin WrbA